MLKKIKRNIFLIYYTIRLICKICKAKFILVFVYNKWNSSCFVLIGNATVVK